MTLNEYVVVYLRDRPGLSVGYCRLLAATVRQLCTWAGRQLELDHADRALLSDWARHLLLTHRPASVNGKLRMVRSLLLAAWDDGLLLTPPRRNRRLSERLPSPEAWTTDECRRLLSYLAILPGRVGERPASDWWVSLVLTLYWSGCRISALLRTPVESYRVGEGMMLTESKTGKSKWHPLPPSCCEAIERVLPESGPIWAWPWHSRTLWLRFRRYVEAAGLPCSRKHTDLFYRLKRTHASYCEAAVPGLAQLQLDHASGETTRRHYLDPRIVGQRSAADVLPDPMLPDAKPILRIVG